MASPQFVVNLKPEDVAGAIDAGIRTALAEALGKADRGKLIEAVVNAAMAEQANTSGYGKKRSMFAEAIDTLIRKEAEAAVTAEMEELRPLVRDLLKLKLKKALDPLTVADSLADAFLEATKRQLYVSVTTHAELGKPRDDDDR